MPELRKKEMVSINGDLLEKLIEKTKDSRSLIHKGGLALYSGDKKIEGERALEKERLIAVRPDLGNNHVPEHSHDYVEIIYMYRGSKTNMVNGETVELNEGEMLFLSQNCRHENMPSGDDDISVNFIVLPHFFERSLEMLGEEETLLHRFIVQCLRGESGKASYLHFKTADVLPVRYLTQTLIWTLINDEPNPRKINETTMGLLLLQLLNHTDGLNYSNDGSGVIIHVLKYIDAHFADGSLSELADSLFYDFNALSKQIKRVTGKTYTELVQEKRLSQACVLLTTTDIGVAEVSRLVGYENISYFHRLFFKTYGMSPKNYRKVNN